MRKDILNWARTCVACQRAKIQRYTRNSPLTFDTPDNRFDHVHLDLVGPLPSLKGYRHLLINFLVDNRMDNRIYTTISNNRTHNR